MSTETRYFRGHPYQYCVAPGEVIDSEAIFRESYWYIRPGEGVIDCGCLHGGYTLPALASGAAFVIAIDPGDMGYALLQEATAANGWLDRLIHHKIGVSDQPGEESCWFDNTYAKTVPMTTIDLLVGAHTPRIDWIKIDTEGFEHKILRGAAETIRRWHPTLIIESHDHLVPRAQALICEALLSIWPHYRIETHSIVSEVVHLVCSPIEAPPPILATSPASVDAPLPLA